MEVEFTKNPMSAGQILRKIRPVLHVLVLALFALLAIPALAVHPYDKWAEELGIDLNVSYDGIRIMEMDSGLFEATECRAPGKMYTEVHVGGMTAMIILREDLGKSYMLMPSMGYYREESLKSGTMKAANGMKFSKIEKVGSDIVLGHPSSKFKTKFKDKNGKGAGFIWVTDTGVVIKTDMIYSSKDVKGMRVAIEFTELNLREQDPAVFEIPTDLKPMDLSDIGSLIKMSSAIASGATTPPPAQDSEMGSASHHKGCLQ